MDPKAIEPDTALGSRSPDLLRRVRISRRPIVITQNGRPTAVLQDVESFSEQRDALLLLKLLAQGTQELRDGKGVPHAEVRKRVERRWRGSKRG